MADDPKQIEENIRQLEAAKASGVLAASVVDASIAALKAQLATFQADLQGDGAIAQGSNAKAVGKGGILVEGDFQGNIFLGKDPEDEAKALAIYRRVVMQTTSSLPLRGVDVGASDPTQAQKTIGLANVYVDLDTTVQVQLTTEEMKQRGKERAFEREETRPLPVLEAMLKNRRFVLLGEPGGGKSTFVNFIAHCLAAHPLEPEAGWLKHLPNWPQAEADLLPIPVILRDFARSYADKLPPKAEPHHLWDFIVARLNAQNLGFVAEPLQKILESGHALVLLDGLDEVPTQAQRLFVRDAVRAFASRFEKCRFLITCRVLSYQPPEKGKPDLRLNELPEFTIAAFDAEKIDHFVSAWYTELARLGTVPAGDVDALINRLQTAVRRSDLQRIAPNPLLLTVMALVHTHKGRLPDARALLYEETIDILLWRWEQIKLGGQEDAPRLRQYLLEAGRTDVDLKRVLWELAYQAHTATKADADGNGLADIPEHRILKALAALKCDEKNPDGDLSWAKRVVDLMKIRAGLLLERQPEIFTFPHRTFQEYLAGAHLAAQADFSQQATALAKKDTPLWREVILYAVGKLVYVSGDMDKPLALTAELCPTDVNDSDMGWRLAWLGGDVLLEIGLKRTKDSAFGRDLLKREQYRLKDLLEGGKLSPLERARAGATLAALGDPRFDDDHWTLPRDNTFGFIHIPAGEFIMGSKKGEGSDERETPQHKLTLSDYWLAKYPVTVAQYRAFVEHSGYKTTDEDSLRGNANHPVVYVTWYDALAYCNWLEKELVLASRTLMVENVDAHARAFWQGLKDGNLHVTLPSEAEWEKAARGTDGKVYPWGNTIDPSKANYDETGINATSAVGCFPAGQSPFGMLDMSGNVWEWTRSIFGEWEKSKITKQRKYPYVASAENERLERNDNLLRSLRGGSFSLGADLARCAFRFRDYPYYWSWLFGFRVSVSPFLPAL